MTGSGSEFLSVVYGLASAVSWGAGDFSGGVATKRASVYSVIILSQLLGGIMLLVCALVLAEAVPSLDNLLIGGLAGISGTIGIVALYSGLAKGRMGLVAPVAGVVTAILPVVVGMFLQGLPPIQQLVGFGLALTAVWFLARGESREPIRWQELNLPVVAGVGFGLFFILIARATGTAVLWPLVSARCTSAFLLVLFTLLRRRPMMPSNAPLPVIALAGIFDSGGNIFFALAARAGRLDISSVLSSLYPGATVLLAWLILKEKLGPRQWLGVGAALLALVLIAA